MMMLSHLQVSSWTFQILKMGPVHQLETSGINYPVTQQHIT